jgi:hypothetical protein
LKRLRKRIEKIPLEEAQDVLNGIEKQLNNRFTEIRSEKYNPNTKGFDYELVLKSFFDSYLSGAFDFLVKVGIIDVNLKVKSLLRPEQNEFDVVAIYKNTLPKLVYQRRVLYDSVAFIVETKQTLTSSSLEADLKKFSKLDELKIDKYRLRLLPKLIDMPGKEVTLKRPLRFLFYYEAEVEDKEVHRMLCGEFGEFWDICLIFKENVVWLNSTLPLIRRQWGDVPCVRDVNSPLLKAMAYTSVSIEGFYLDSWLIFWNLFRSAAPNLE